MTRLSRKHTEVMMSPPSSSTVRLSVVDAVYMLCLATDDIVMIVVKCHQTPPSI